MKIEALQTIAQLAQLEARKLEDTHQYDYALISPVGETVGWLKLSGPANTYRKIMIDNSFKIFGTIVIENESIKVI